MHRKCFVSTSPNYPDGSCFRNFVLSIKSSFWLEISWISPLEQHKCWKGSEWWLQFKNQFQAWHFTVQIFQEQRSNSHSLNLIETILLFFFSFLIPPHTRNLHNEGWHRFKLLQNGFISAVQIVDDSRSFTENYCYSGRIHFNRFYCELSALLLKATKLFRILVDLLLLSISSEFFDGGAAVQSQEAIKIRGNTKKNPTGIFPQMHQRSSQ